jgi:hypothetical protein
VYFRDVLLTCYFSRVPCDVILPHDRQACWERVCSLARDVFGAVTELANTMTVRQRVSVVMWSKISSLEDIPQCPAPQATVLLHTAS